MSNSPLVNYINISPNKTSPRNHDIDTITIHCMAGNLTIEVCGQIFASESRKASSNYGIGSDGRIGMYVEEKDRSWCSSSATNDHRAITIEVANDGGEDTGWHISDKAYSSLIDLCVDICKRNNIKELKWEGDKSLIGQVSRQNMTAHRWFAAKACPGDYLYNLHSQIASDVNARLNGNSNSDILYRVQVGAYSKKNNAESMVAKLKSAGFEAFIVTQDVDGKSETLNLEVGDQVKLEKDAPQYGTSSKFAPWIYDSILYVRQINEDRIVISTLSQGAITGVVDKKYLTKI